MSPKQIRAALWEVIIARTEALHDASVLSQVRPTPKAAARLGALAEQIAALARAAELSGRRL